MSATQDEVNKQRAALLTAVAQQGTAGKTAYEAEAARQAEAAKAAAAAVTASTHGTAMGVPPALLAQIAAQNAAQQSVYAQDNKMATTNYDNSLAQTSMSNAAYMDQARAAVPVVEAQTAGQIAQIRAQQEEQARQRAFAREQEQWAREDHARQIAEQRAQQTQQDNGYAQDFLRSGQDEARKRLIASASLEKKPEFVDQLGGIIDASGDLDSAMRLSLTLLRSQGAPATAIREMQRYVYQYYTGNKPSTDPQNFGYQVRKYGGHADYVPGYLNASER